VSKTQPLDDKTEKFLSQFKLRTRESYRNRLKYFAKTAGIQDVLAWIENTDVHELKGYIQAYYQKQLEQGAKINSLLATVTALRSIATEYGKTIKFRKGVLDKVEEDQNSYEISSNDLARLWDVSDLTERTILATAASLGLEVSSFLQLKRDKVRSLVEKAIAEKEQFTFWVDNRSKTSAKRLNVLGPVAIEYLKKYFDANINRGYKALFPYSENGIGAMLKRLFQKASIDTAKQKVRFHSIRKWLMTKLNESGANIYSVKLILGKAIEVSDSTYLNHLEQTALEEYKKAYPKFLCFTNGKAETQVVKDLEKARLDVDSLRTAMGLLHDENRELKRQMEEVYRFMHENFDPVLDALGDPEVVKALQDHFGKTDKKKIPRARAKDTIEDLNVDDMVGGEHWIKPRNRKKQTST
jgi:site-specific recombinase XerD